MKKLILILILVGISFSEIVGYWSAKHSGNDTLFDMKGAANGISTGVNDPIFNPAQNNIYFHHGLGGLNHGNDIDRIEIDGTQFHYTTSSTFSILYFARTDGNDGGRHEVYDNIFNGGNSISSQLTDTSISYRYLDATLYEDWRKTTATNRNRYTLGVQLNTTGDRLPYFNTQATTVTTPRALSGNYYKANSFMVLGAFKISSTDYYYGNYDLYLSTFINFNHRLRSAEISNYNTFYRGGFQ